MADKLTDAQLASLTDEEREGLLEDEGEDEDEDEAGEEGDDGEPGDADAAPDTTQADADADPATVGDGDAAGKPAAPVVAADGAPDASAEAETQPEPEATPAWVLPGDFDDRLKGVKDERKALAKKFDDGDLTGGELQEQLQALDDRYDALREQKIKASIALDTAKESFGAAVSTFLSEHPQYDKGSALYGLLDAEVRKLQAGAANPLSPALLAKAHAKIDADLRKALGVAPAPAGKPDSKPAGKPAAPAAKRPEAPPTLRNVPAADMEDVSDGGEFAALERLAAKDSVAHERAMADLKKRDPVAFDRYMQQ